MPQKKANNTTSAWMLEILEYFIKGTRMPNINKPKICFCAFNAYPLLCKRKIETIGGAELQQVLLGEELCKRGYEVIFIVSDYGQEPIEIIDGIKVIKALEVGYASLVNKPWIHAISQVFDAFNKANADVYYQRCGSYYTGIVSLFCMLMNKRFIYQLGSDMDADINYIKAMKYHHRLLYRFGVLHADHIIAQSIYQQKMVKKIFKRDSLVIKNLHPIKSLEQKKSTTPIILWVGTIKPEWKQPELFLKLAKMIPEAKFQIIGGPSKDKGFYDKIRLEAKEIKNLEFVGFVQLSEIENFFNNATIFVNTSSIEGFPNTFLQAWAACMPVVSLNVDPDEIICKYNLGFHSKTMDNLAHDIKVLLSDELLRTNMGLNGRRYVEREHNMEDIVRKFSEVLNE